MNDEERSLWYVLNRQGDEIELVNERCDALEARERALLDLLAQHAEGMLGAKALEAGARTLLAIIEERQEIRQ